MPAVLVTTRQIQNFHTGIDASVPEYQEIRGKMMSGHVEYHIVVVTRLSAFKSAKHKPEDAVQFVVSKKYSEIEELYQKLVVHYPHVSLPPVPRKVLFVGESDIRERRVTFDELMRFVSREESLANSPEFLEFLGTKCTSAVDSKNKNLCEKQKEEAESEPFDFFREDTSSDFGPQPISDTKEKTEKKMEEEEEEEEEEMLDPLGIMKAKKTKKLVVVKADKPKPRPRLALFDEEVVPDEGLFGTSKDFSFISNTKTSFGKDDLKLFEDQDLGGTVKIGDSLLLPTAFESKAHTISTTVDEDTEELFRVEEDFEKLLQMGSKVTSKPKPKVPPKPALPKKSKIADKNVSSSSPPIKQPDHIIESMDGIDILKYIQDNESADKDSMSLF